MWTHVYNSTLLLHWNVNSLWAVHNEAMREFPYWKYYHFTQGSDCIPLKADINKKRMGCNILTQLHQQEDPDQHHYVHIYLNLDINRQQLSRDGCLCCCVVFRSLLLHVQFSPLKLLNSSARTMSPVWRKSPSLCDLMTQRKVNCNSNCGLNLRELINVPLKLGLFWPTCRSLFDRMHVCNWALKAALISILIFSLHIPFKHLLVLRVGRYQCIVFIMFHCPQEVKINMHQRSFKRL